MLKMTVATWTSWSALASCHHCTVSIFVFCGKTFNKRLQKIEWKNYYKSWPFNESALALYEWAPVAKELKTLDRKIVLNSMILKWENIEKEFIKLIDI